MNENKQQLLTSGSILHLARIDPNTGISGPPADVGTIQVVNPTAEATTIALFDSRGGRRVKISERVTEYNERYEITCSNMSIDNLSYVFGADSVQTYSQPGTPQAAVPHLVYPDSVLHLHDGSGNYMYDISVLTSIGTLVAGTDYTADANDLKMGIAHILPGAAVAAGGATMNVTFTPNAITGRRVFMPQTAGVVKCEAWVYWVSDDYQTIMLRDHFNVDVTPANPEFRDTDYSQLRFNLSVLSDRKVAGRPAGRFVTPKLLGGEPPRTY